MADRARAVGRWRHLPLLKGSVRALLRRVVAATYRAAIRSLQRSPEWLSGRVNCPAVRLGTAYGGWWVAEHPSLRHGLVISAGAGEDISFDVEIARRFDASVVIVDPTPRAIDHVERVLSRATAESTSDLVEGGHQSPDSYDLTGIRSGQIRLVPAALWSNSSGLDLYPPPDPTFVSFSATDFRNHGRRATEPLRVSSARVDDLLHSPDHPVAVLKLDIEGAEVEVIRSMLDGAIRPTQVLVEFDELARPSIRHVTRAIRAVLSLRAAGYRLFRHEGLNYSFIHGPH